jgi:hypothetical protein
VAEQPGQSPGDQVAQIALELVLGVVVLDAEHRGVAHECDRHGEGQEGAILRAELA